MSGLRYVPKAAEDCRTPRPIGSSWTEVLAKRLGVRQSSAAFTAGPA